MADTRILLTELPTRLRAHFGEATPNYRFVYGLVLDGRIAMQREVGFKGYFCRPEDLPIIVETIRGIIARKAERRLARRMLVAA